MPEPLSNALNRYRNVYFHKRVYTLEPAFFSSIDKPCTETKNTWARDDPAILILLGGEYRSLCGTLLPSNR